MALVKCKECGAEVAKNAKSCPQCGIAHPGVGKLETLIGAVILIGLFGTGMVMCSSDADDQESPEKLAACQKDLQCWGDRHSFKAQMACKPTIENQAQYSFRWIEDKVMFNKYVLREQNRIMYFGDGVEFQNGFGAYQRMSYGCEYDPATDTATDIIMEKGPLG